MLSTMALNYLQLTLSIMLFSHCSSHLDKEPKCSQFDFQEKLLEKMVRIEHSSELMKAELATARDERLTTKEELAKLRLKANTEQARLLASIEGMLSWIAKTLW